MAILHTLRTNKILKTLTFIIIGVGMYLFVDPQFDAFKTIADEIAVFEVIARD